MMKTTAGKVYLVGAGPGDPGLITVKGKTLLGICDVVIYDNLVPDELVVTMPPHIEKYYVGKRAGKACASQDEINSLMVKLALSGKTIVRLKGSDPLIFGRGGEEAKYLKANNVPFEIVPGVTAGIAAPTYAGIPCTDREKASFVTFVTGHKAREKQTSTVPWDWLAKAKGGTIVVYMGVGEIGNIVTSLIDGGMDKDISSAVIERGTYPSQRVITSSLENLPGAVRDNKIKPPALFVIGEVVDIQKQMQWLGDKPLFGFRIMVTRPSDQSEFIYESLRDLGAEVLPYPTIATEEYIDEKAWEAIKLIPGNGRWLVLTSENTVRYFISQFLERIGDLRNLAKYKIAAMGNGTVRALSKYNLKADFIPEKSSTDEFTGELASKHDLKDSTIVRVQGNRKNETLDKDLMDAGGTVIPIRVYNTVFPEWTSDFKDKLINFPPDVIIFSSGMSVEGLYNCLDFKQVDAITKSARIISIGPTTSRIIESHGLKVSLEAKIPSIPSLIEELKEFLAKR